MKSLVVYDSFFGNTEKVAQAIGGVLGAEIRRVSALTLADMQGLDLLLVGSPTRGFKPSPAIVEWLKGLPTDGLKGVTVSAFDTRIPLNTIKSPVFRFIVGRGGYADKSIAKALQQKGGEWVIPTEGFFVEESEGPLLTGELERAAAWARKFL